jgi:hypothetical protein
MTDDLERMEESFTFLCGLVLGAIAMLAIVAAVVCVVWIVR